MDRDRRTTGTALALAVAMLAALAPSAGAAVGGHEGLPNVDRRANDSAAVPATRQQARRALERDLGELADVRTERFSGAVSYVGRPDGLLTGPSGDDPRTIALNYVRERGDVFGLSKTDVANLKLVAGSVSPDGITHLRFNQVLDGIQSFDSGLQAHVTGDGRLINVSGAPLPGATLPSTTPATSATAGLGDARRAARRSGPPPRVQRVRAGARRVTTFVTGERAVLVTDEPLGGSLVPTRAPIVAARV